MLVHDYSDNVIEKMIINTRELTSGKIFQYYNLDFIDPVKLSFLLEYDFNK